MRFDQIYDQQEFLKFLGIFLPEDFVEKEEDIVIKKDRNKEITKAKILGFCESLDLYILEMDHSRENDPRIAIATDAFKILADHWMHKALVIFKNKDSDNYRLSFLTISLDLNEKNKPTKRYSNARRYSFFLGPSAKVNTPTKFLISKGRVTDFDDLKSRFSIEIVTKEFFENYKKLFDRLLEYLNKDHSFQSFAGRNGVETASFAKKLLGQIVFLYFLQRKGWLGAEKGESISTGDKNFLRSLFNKSVERKTNFYNEYLEKLFYGALNKPAEKAGSYYRSYFDCQIPFLNGGLFEPPQNYDWEGEFLLLPDKLFSKDPNNPSHGDGILDIFDLYNFTIDEGDSLDKEVSVDPEMLGKVFENLLEENLRRGNGTYYTPREIVNYMCEESLVSYLASATGLTGEDVKNKYLPAYNVLGDEKIEVRDVTVSEQIIESLQSIKVVDPACGSGAFLVGMLQQITHLRYDLETRSKLLGRRDTASSEYDIKKQTIQNCIYGVDLDPGAVEIAKLRLWLSLVVDYDLEDIEPLPNLDYKIMQGNSLLEELVLGDTTVKLYDRQTIQKAVNSKRMKNLFEADPQIAMFDDIKKEQALKNMKALQVQYFSQSDAGEKKTIKTQIEKIERDLIEASVKAEADMLSAQRLNIKPLPGVGLLPEDAKRLMSISSKESQIMAVLEELKKTGTKPFFLWHLNFADVFEEKGGFDVVIANPPYGADIDKKQLAVMKKGVIDTKNSNSAAIFIDFGKNVLLNKNGTMSYIVPKSLLFSEVWFDLVKTMLGKVSILVDVEKAFEKVLLEQVLFVYGNSVKTNSYYARKFLNNDFIRSIDIPNEVVYKFNAWICDVSKEELVLAEKILSKINIKLMFNISKTKRGVPLQKYLKESGQHPVLGGKNIFRYGLSGVKGFLKDEDLENNGKLAFLQQPKILSQRLVAHIQNPIPHIKIMSTFDPTGELLSVDTVENTVISDKKFDHMYILSLLNSKLIGWYTYKFIFCAAIRTMDFDNYYVGKIPVPEISHYEQNAFIDLVKKIMQVTESKTYQEDESHDYGQQLDHAIYKLYDLTEEEIRIVEGK